MKRFRGIATVGLIWSFTFLSSSGCAGEQARQSPNFEVVGPQETAAFERSLDRRLAAYAWGIWPRSERLAGALRGADLPKQYVNRLQTWLQRIVRKELLPVRIDPNQFYGIARLRGGHNFIIGRLSRPGQSTTVQFQANGLRIVITAQSQSLFPNGVYQLSDADIIKAIAGLLNYPEEKVASITIEKHFEELGETDKKIPVCYGRLRSDGYDEKKGPFQTKEGRMVNIPTWWNDMIFWVRPGELFISSTMVDWETMPANLDPYVFKFGRTR